MPGAAADAGPRNHINRRILHSGSKAQRQEEFQKPSLVGSFVIMWSLGPVADCTDCHRWVGGVDVLQVAYFPAAKRITSGDPDMVDGVRGSEDGHIENFWVFL